MNNNFETNAHTSKQGIEQGTGGQAENDITQAINEEIELPRELIVEVRSLAEEQRVDPKQLLIDIIRESLNKKESVWSTIKREIKFFSVQISSLLMTSLFLILVVAFQWGVNRFIEWLNPQGLDFIVLVGFQIIFCLASWITIAYFYYVNIRIIIIKGQKRIEEARKK